MLRTIFLQYFMFFSVTQSYLGEYTVEGCEIEATFCGVIHLLAQNQFRNLMPCELRFGPGVTVVAGKNGQGKTNLLEAIHWVTQGFSPRTRSFDGAVKWQADEAWIRMEGLGKTGHPVRQGILWRGGAVVTKVDATESRSLVALHGNLHVVMMGPEDIALIKDGPDQRRRWVDLLLSARYTDGLDLLMRYRRTLAQRNRWLKDRRGGTQVSSPADWQAFEALTEQLSTLGATIMVRRSQLLQELSPQVSAYYHDLSSGAEAVELEYLGSVKVEEGDESFVQAKLLRKMTAMRTVELSQGITAAGPHRDDIAVRFALHGASLRESGSQGQCRTAALAMGIVALDVGSGKEVEPPILLLDDIFAELDAYRRNALADLIRAKKCQVFVATPRAEDLPFSADAMLHVEAGIIRSV